MAMEVLTQVVMRDLYLAWTPDGEVAPILLHKIAKKFDPGMSGMYQENTAGGNDLVTSQRIRGKVDPKGTFGYYKASTGEAIAAEFLNEGTIGTLEWGIEGNATGKPRASIKAQINKSNTPVELDGLVEVEIEFVNIGTEWIFDPATARYTTV